MASVMLMNTFEYVFDDPVDMRRAALDYVCMENTLLGVLAALIYHPDSSILKQPNVKADLEYLGKQVSMEYLMESFCYRLDDKPACRYGKLLNMLNELGAPTLYGFMRNLYLKGDKRRAIVVDFGHARKFYKKKHEWDAVDMEAHSLTHK